MKATAIYDATAAIIDRLAELAATVGHPLSGVEVAYARTGEITDRAIYAGGGRFTQDQASAEGEVRRETDTMGLYVRVFGRASTGLPDVRSTDAEVTRIADVVAGELADDPKLTGELTFTQIRGGARDFYPSDDGIEAILALSIEVDAWLE